ncbi:MAG: N-acetyltransferase [candidate division Zixibacteria bacterium]|nr:N-acetyltransferase [candidate division Zixibacteria bacterium]MDH3937750.1 N-acetyltransferase [candidate division Zixibacteria bacterium]MDH4032853.1 N-acetyltransferase [candidate division Zixibacteria bacterium]
MATVNILEVESSAHLNDFIDLPNRLYKGDPNYVTPLKSERLEFFDRDKNPFYKTAKTKLFLAERDGELAGRIAICVNFTHNEVHEEQTGFFGFFECVDDFEVASALLKTAMIELKREGMERMRGPVSFSTNHECGFLIEGFDSPPVIMMTYNKPYLPRLAEKFGLKKGMDLLAYKLTKENPIPDRVQKIVEKLRKRSGVTFRNIRMNDFANEVQRIRRIYNEAWEHNWGFVPMNEDEFTYLAKGLKQIVEPELLFIAEHEDRPVAFLMAVPDVNQALIHLKGKLMPSGVFKLLWHTKISNKIDGVRVMTMGVVPDFRKRGLDSILYVDVFNRGIERGYRWGELSWILETNELMRSAIEQMGADLYKRYRIVEMPL